MSTDLLRSDFLLEAGSLVEEMEEAIDPAWQGDLAALETLFRNAHTLKGLGQMFEQGALTQLAAQVEAMLRQIRLGRLACDKQTLNILRDAIEEILSFLDGRKLGGDLASRITKFVSDGVGAHESARKANPPPALTNWGIDSTLALQLTEYEEHRLRENLVAGHGIHRVACSFASESFKSDLAQLRSELGDTAEVITYLSAVSSDSNRLRIDLVLASAATVDVLRERLGDDRSLDTLVKSRN